MTRAETILEILQDIEERGTYNGGSGGTGSAVTAVDRYNADKKARKAFYHGDSRMDKKAREYAAKDKEKKDSMSWRDKAAATASRSR